MSKGSFLKVDYFPPVPGNLLFKEEGVIVPKTSGGFEGSDSAISFKNQIKAISGTIIEQLIVGTIIDEPVVALPDLVPQNTNRIIEGLAKHIKKYSILVRPSTV